MRRAGQGLLFSEAKSHVQRRWATGAQGLVHGCGPYSLPPGPSKGPGETKQAPPRGAEGAQDQGGMGVPHLDRMNRKQ